MTESSDHVLNRVARRGALVLGQVIIFLAFGELFIALTGLDAIILEPLLYYQDADVPIHQPSENVKLHYDLKKSGSLVDPDGGRRITINALGIRGRERSPKKPSGVFRVICLGASNTLGSAVNDDQTYSAVLEAILNRNLPGKYEVWNAGVNAYLLSQQAALAEEMMRLYDPDLLVFYHNAGGARAFLPGQPFLEYFRQDSYLYLENLKFVPFESVKLNLWFLSRWRLFRTLVALLNHADRVPTNNPFHEGRAYNYHEFWKFYSRHRDKLGIAVLIAPPKDSDGSVYESMGIAPIYLKNHLPRNLDLDFGWHQSTSVNKLVGQVLVSELKRRKLVGYRAGLGLPRKGARAGRSRDNEWLAWAEYFNPPPSETADRGDPFRDLAALCLVQARFAAKGGLHLTARRLLEQAENLRPGLLRKPLLAAFYKSLDGDLSAPGIQSPAPTAVSPRPLEAAGSRPGAIQAANNPQAVRNDSSSSDPEMRRRAKRLLDLKQYPKALAVLQRLAQDSPDDIGLWIEQANVAVLAADRGLALSSLDRAEALKPRPTDWNRIALVYQELGEYRRALGILDRIVAEDPGRAGFLSDRGLCRYLSGSTDEAVQDVRAAIVLDPNLLSAYLTLGSIHAARKEYRQAVDVYDEALSRRTSADSEALRDMIRRSRAEALPKAAGKH